MRCSRSAIWRDVIDRHEMSLMSLARGLIVISVTGLVIVVRLLSESNVICVLRVIDVFEMLK